MAQTKLHGKQVVTTPVEGEIPVFQADGTMESEPGGAAIIGSGFFGDGSDGDVTTAGDLTLLRDMFYEDLVVSAGDTVYVNGFRIFCSKTLTVVATGTISAGGADGNLSLIHI